MSTLKRGVRQMSWALLVLTFLLPAAARAAEEAKQPSRAHVVLIGISDYADKQIKDRPRAEDDAKALYDLFTSKDYLGADPKDVKLLLGKADEKRNSIPATHKNILDAVKSLVADSRRDDLVVFAFFGQGCSLGERGGDRTCYFASDSTLEGRAKNAIASADLGQEFDKLKSHKFCVFLDVNFKGVDAGKLSIPEPSLGESPYKEFLGDDEGEDHVPLPGRVVFLATNGLHPSIEMEKNGLFTHTLLAGLKGEADKEGYEPDGVISVDELTTYLNKEMPGLRRKHGKTEDDRKHEHFIVGGASSHFALTTNPKAAVKVRDRLRKLDALSERLGKELTDEGHRLLERMPKLEGQRSLRKEYQNLVDGELTLPQLRERRQTLLTSMQLPAADARKFASTVLDGIQIVAKEDGYVKEVNRGELVAWGLRGMYRRLDEKIPEDISEKLTKVKDMDIAQLGALLMEARSKLGKREDLDKHKDIDIALQRALGRLDPYTTYIDPDTVKRFDQEVRGEFHGIGVQIRKDTTTDMLQVVTPIKNSPSYRIGLMAGDLITTITREVDSEGEPLDKPEVISTKDVTLSDAVKKILGKAGTKVKLTIKREGKDQPFEVEITRNRIELESVFGVKRNADDGWDYWLDKENQIGYIRLTSFMPNSSRELTRAVRNMRMQGMRGLILDLRFNPGGLLESAREISDLFIDEGPIVSIRRPRLGQEHRMDGKSAGSELDFKMVCLVNGYSASASEIVSACLQDHNRSVIMGERSYGKGSVQNIQEFDGGKIKVTIASFWRPSGKNLNKSSTGGKEDEDWGVKPDKGFLIELSRKEREDLGEHLRNTEIIPRRDPDRPAKKPDTEFKDKQLETAVKYLREKVRASR